MSNTEQGIGSGTPGGTLSQYGGQAVIEGVMMRSPHYFAVACRKPDGEIVVQREEVDKTFLKKITDADGNDTYRKIETRLIVARPDGKKADGTAEVTALFGTYAWNEEETEARLLAATPEALDRYLERVLMAHSLAEVFED